MIVFGVVASSEALAEQAIEPSMKTVAEPDSLVLRRVGESSIAHAYNRIIYDARGFTDLEALVLLHQDTELLDADFCEKVRRRLEDKSIGLIGVIGARRVRSIVYWKADMCGYVKEGNRTLDFGGGFQDVDAIDGLLMILAPRCVQEMAFDEHVTTAFHGYDIDFSFQVRHRGLRVVVDDLSVVHHTRGGYGDRRAYLLASRAWRRKWLRGASAGVRVRSWLDDLLVARQWVRLGSKGRLSLPRRRTPKHGRDSHGENRPTVLIAVHSAQRAGAEIMALQEAEKLAERFKVVAAVSEGPLRTEFAQVGHLVAGPATMPLVFVGIRATTRRAIRNMGDVVRWLVILKANRVALVIANSTVVVAPVIAARLLGIPVLVHARDITSSRLARCVLAIHKHLASTIVAISSEVERSLGNASRSRIVCVPYGVDDVSEGSRSGAVQRKRPSVAVVGTIERRKGQDVALEALGLVRADGVELDLVLIGREQDADFASALRVRAVALGLGDNLHFVGSVADVDREVASVDIVIGPSRAEPLGLALMEAMALGKPVIASRVGGIPEFISDGETGMLVSPEAPEELAAALLALATNQEAARALGEAGRRHITTHFTLDMTMNAYGREIDRLIATNT